MPGKHDDPHVIPALKAEQGDPWSKTMYTWKKKKDKSINKQDKNKSQQKANTVKICTKVPGRKLEKQLYTWKVSTITLFPKLNSINIYGPCYIT